MTKDAILHMRISEAEISALDELRRQEKDIPTRSEMVRRLIARADGWARDKSATLTQGADRRLS
jgi:hypothetical protein